MNLRIGALVLAAALPAGASGERSPYAGLEELPIKGVPAERRGV